MFTLFVEAKHLLFFKGIKQIKIIAGENDGRKILGSHSQSCWVVKRWGFLANGDLQIDLKFLHTSVLSTERVKLAIPPHRSE